MVLSDLFCSVDYFEIITIFDAMDLKVIDEFCVEEFIRPLVKVMSYTGLEKKGKLEFKNYSMDICLKKFCQSGGSQCFFSVKIIW